MNVMAQPSNAQVHHIYMIYRAFLTFIHYSYGAQHRQARSH